MEDVRERRDSGPPAAVGIAAMVGVAKAVLEGIFGIIGLAAADSIDDSFGLGATVFAVLYALSSWMLWRGNRAAYYVTAALSALGLAVAVIYLFRATDVAFGAAILMAALNAFVLYLLGRKSAREYVGR